jgi:chromosome segregation ATPase
MGLNRLRKYVKDLEVEYDTEISSLNTTISVLNATISLLNSTLSEIESDNEALRANASQFKNKLAAVSKHLSIITGVELEVNEHNDELDNILAYFRLITGNRFEQP